MKEQTNVSYDGPDTAGPDTGMAAELVEIARMAAADPVFVDRLEGELVSRHSGGRNKQRAYQQIRLAAAVALTVVAVGGLAVIALPPLRAFAQEVYRFFVPDQDDSQTVEAWMPAGAHEDSPEGGDSSQPPLITPIPAPTAQPGEPIRLPDSFTGEVPFEVWGPAYVQAGYELDRMDYHSMGHMTSLTFECRAGEWGYMVWQRQIGPEDLVLEMGSFRHQVGASAILETIPLRSVTAEYVRGSWVPASEPDFSDAGPGTSVPLDMVWSSETSYHHLVWYEGGYLFQIFTSRGNASGLNRGACAMDKEGFVRVAQSMQPDR